MVKEPWEDLNEDPSDQKRISYDSYFTVVRTEAWKVSVTCAGSPNLAVLGPSSEFGQCAPSPGRLLVTVGEESF